MQVDENFEYDDDDDYNKENFSQFWNQGRYRLNNSQFKPSSKKRVSFSLNDQERGFSPDDTNVVYYDNPSFIEKILIDENDYNNSDYNNDNNIDNTRFEIIDLEDDYNNASVDYNQTDENKNYNSNNTHENLNEDYSTQQIWDPDLTEDEFNNDNELRNELRNQQNNQEGNEQKNQLLTRQSRKKAPLPKSVKMSSRTSKSGKGSSRPAKKQKVYTGPLTPTLAEKFIMNRKLGEGGFGSVYQVTSRENSSVKYAVKIVKLSNEDERGLDRSTVTELSLLSRLQHPNIIRLFGTDYYPEKNRLALILELADTDLARMIDYELFSAGMRSRRNADVAFRLQVTYDMFCGLHYLHTHNVLHLDLKPLNVLIIGGRAKLADFGLSDRLDSLKNADREKNTWGYRAPELHCGSSIYSSSADIWSMGIVLCELFFSTDLFDRSIRPKEMAKEKNLFSFILEKIGTPSKQWMSKYRKYDCETPSGTKFGKTSVYYPLETALFGDSKSKRSFYSTYYGQDLYDSILDLIHRCLLFEPEDRIEFFEAINHPIFAHANCQCDNCTIEKANTFTPSSKNHSKIDQLFDPAVASIVRSFPRRVQDYTVEIYTRASATNPSILNQLASLSLATKILNVKDINRLRYEWTKTLSKSTKNKISLIDLNNAELELGNSLGWNLDG